MQSPKRRELTPELENGLRETLKRCSPETVEAALGFHRTGDVGLVSTVIIGIIERFLEPELRVKVKGDCDSLRVFEDLGVDSLTLVEIIMAVEESLGITINNEEVRDLRTIGDIRTFIQAKLGGGPAPEARIRLDGMQIGDTLPHGHPFLFLQEASVSATGATGSYTISGKEYFLEGHFKNNPVFPASLMLEALGQLAVLYLLKAKSADLVAEVDPSAIFFISSDGVRCQRKCIPGDTLRMEVKVRKIHHPMSSFEGVITVGNEKAAFAESISLTFDYRK